MGQVGQLRVSRVVSTRNESYTSGEENSNLDGFICPSDRCGRAFSEPVHLTDLSHRPKEEAYYACPFCFTRLNIDGVIGETEHSKKRSQRKSKTDVEVSASISKVKKSEKSDEENIGISTCKHQFGYLKSRPRGSEIPDECLTCPKILNCMN